NPPPAFSPPELALDDSPLCEAWMRAIFARVVFPPQLPLDPGHRATHTAAAVTPPTLWLRPRCSRSLSFAPLPLAGSVPNTVSLPLAVPFLQSVSLLTVSFLGFTPPSALR